MARKWKRLQAVLVALVGCLFIAGWVINHQLQKLVAARQLAMEGSPTVEQMLSLLDYSDTIVLKNTMSQLEHSGSDAGRKRAVELLGHSDIYVSYCSALHLASIGDQRSVPYLIRGLDHPARRSRPRLVQYLKTLTQQDFGENKDQWIQWWKSQNPSSSFDFTTKKP